MGHTMYIFEFVEQNYVKGITELRMLGYSK